MVCHVALFRPKAGLSAADRSALVSVLDKALRGIPTIRRFEIGRRVRHGAGYEALMSVDLEYAAVIEFDDLAGLQAYLAHPAHQALGRQFMQSLEASAIYDYEMVGAAELLRLASESPRNG